MDTLNKCLGVYPPQGPSKFDISVVTSCYRSENFVSEFYARHKVCLDELGLSYEFIFVNDGSPDSSKKVVLDLIAKEKNIKLIDFSRNFGQHAGMFAGMANAAGAWVYATDCDLEEAPENIVSMYKILMEDESVDVVYGKLNQRSHGFVNDIVANVFYSTLNFLSEVNVPRNQAWQRIMSRKYTHALLQHAETESLPAGLMILSGFNQVPFAVEKRYKGSSSYTFKKKIRLALNSIVSFSSRPLILIALLGFFITACSFFGIAGIVYSYYANEAFNPGWASIVVSIYLVGGLTLSALGVIGIYLSKVFNQVKARPMFVVKEIVESK